MTKGLLKIGDKYFPAEFEYYNDASFMYRDTEGNLVPSSYVATYSRDGIPESQITSIEKNYPSEERLEGVIMGNARHFSYVEFDSKRFLVQSYSTATRQINGFSGEVEVLEFVATRPL